MTSGLTLPGGAIVGHAAVTHIGVLPSSPARGSPPIWCVISCTTSPHGVRWSRRCGPRRRRSMGGTATASRVRRTPSRFRRHARSYARCRDRRPGAPAGRGARCGTSCPASVPRIVRPGREPSTARRCGGRAAAALRIVPGAFVCRGARRAGCRNRVSHATVPSTPKVVRQRSAHHRRRGFLRPHHRRLPGADAFSARARSC